MRPARPRALHAPEQLHLLETFASQTALALERARLAEEAQQAQVRVETERTAQLAASSVSHDLRTPLATITGATSTLLEDEARLDAATRRELLESMHDEADRLNRLVSNLLDMTRLESGALQLHTEWHPLEEVVGAALAGSAARWRGRRVDHPRAARPAAGADRRRADRAGADQPAGERDQVHAGRQPDRGIAGRRRRA